MIAVTVTCEQEVKSNITYIVSPGFPALMDRDIGNCTLKIKMMSADVSQLRFDFIHFALVRYTLLLSAFFYTSQSQTCSIRSYPICNLLCIISMANSNNKIQIQIKKNYFA